MRFQTAGGLGALSLQVLWGAEWGQEILRHRGRQQASCQPCSGCRAYGLTSIVSLKGGYTVMDLGRDDFASSLKTAFVMFLLKVIKLNYIFHE